MVLTAAGCAAGCNAVVQAAAPASRLASSGPCCSEGGPRRDRCEPLAEVWVAAAPRCVRYCDRCCARWWVRSQAALGRGVRAPSSVRMPSHLSQACRHRAEASGTFLRSGIEGCNWLRHKTQTEQKREEKKEWKETQMENENE